MRTGRMRYRAYRRPTRAQKPDRYDAPVPLDPHGRIGRSLQAMASSRWFGKVGPTVMPPLDRALHRAFGGRVLLSSMMLPCAIVTTTGRKSGEPRESPLATVPLDGGLYVVGSNFGKAHHPAWSWNLLADPTARISFRGEDFAATASLLDDDQKATTWPRLIERWPLFDQYVDRSGRDLRVFRLQRADGRPIS
jgi:deazaflavin-dependent oxidoreductase (nitroreductase family)